MTYQEKLPDLGELGLVPVDPAADAALLHGWVTQPWARFWGMGDHTEAEVREVYAFLDGLATHHAYLWRELPRIEALADKVTSVHGARHPELAAVRDAVQELRTELEPHLSKEERVLFPLVRGLAAGNDVGAPTPCGGSVRNPISVMLREHDRAGDLLDRLRALTGGYVPPADGCASYVAYYRALAEVEADTHLHVHKENNLLFPAVVTLEEARNVGSGTVTFTVQTGVVDLTRTRAS